MNLGTLKSANAAIFHGHLEDNTMEGHWIVFKISKKTAAPPSERLFFLCFLLWF